MWPLHFQERTLSPVFYYFPYFLFLLNLIPYILYGQVREAAAITLGGFLHCGYMTMDKAMMVRGCLWSNMYALHCILLKLPPTSAPEMIKTDPSMCMSICQSVLPLCVQKRHVHLCTEFVQISHMQITAYEKHNVMHKDSCTHLTFDPEVTPRAAIYANFMQMNLGVTGCTNPHTWHYEIQMCSSTN